MFAKKLTAVRALCPEVEMVFIDAPHVLQPVDLPDPSEMGYFIGFDALPPKSEPQRGWWKTQNIHDAEGRKNISTGLEVTLMFLKDVLKEKKFDGVLGFSQGAVLAALLSGLLEKPQAYPKFLDDGKAPHPPFEFCISVAGYKPIDPLGASLLTPNYKTPTLHVIGHNDIIVTPEWSQSLIDVSLNARVEFHEGGHFVPTKTPWRRFLANYMRNPSDDTPGPNRIAAPIDEPVTPVLE
ncbi:hypothetical protein BT96DRAFT_963447 [Gymnopus androsaceus JB14]|uniref:Serine hydrolase domain-containing protein n=1 Tax=Gymnopus androsaceus JB14 TaxID=1447944 RepID=A0A6A4I9K0_9AGAR|nr:hypothetical protein BT96DRAFT_963447 [Gymnopus androsaceus JB14]